MRRPSGDQSGCPSAAELSVSLLTPDPSEFITYISMFPPRSETNAMRPNAVGVWVTVVSDLGVGVGVGVIVGAGVGVTVDADMGVASPESRTLTYNTYSIVPESLDMRISALPSPVKESSSAPMVTVASQSE